MVYRNACYVVGVASLALGACLSGASDSSASSSGGGPPPTVSITSPANGAVVTLDFAAGDTNINGTVATTNFKVVPVGQPGDGQVWILVDGPQCNTHSDLGMLLPYNTTVPSTEADGPKDGKSFGAGIDYCFNAPPQDIKIAGMHKITAELHRSDGSAVQVAGKTVSSSIVVTVQLAPTDGGTDAGADASDGG
jgi:hypothetical protein